jgi:hypothetical protein
LGQAIGPEVIGELHEYRELVSLARKIMHQAEGVLEEILGSHTHTSVIAQREAVNLLDEQVFPNVPKNADEDEKRAGVASPTN